MRIQPFFLVPLLCAGLAATCPATPIANLPGYEGVGLYEISDFSYGYIFAQVIGVHPALTTRLSGPLGYQNRDFGTSGNEHYDIFFSDADGTFNALGEYISIEAAYETTSGGGGLNIDAVFIGFGGNIEYASFVSSFLPSPHGGYLAGSETKILGVENGKATTLGYTANGDRIRITVGFPTPSPTPEPATWSLMGAALFATGYAVRRRVPRQVLK